MHTSPYSHPITVYYRSRWPLLALYLGLRVGGNIIAWVQSYLQLYSITEILHISLKRNSIAVVGRAVRSQDLCTKATC